MNHDNVKDGIINKDNDDSFKPNIYFFIICINMFIIIIILIVSLVKLNKGDSIMKMYRTKDNEKTIILSSNYQHIFHNRGIQ